uniref:Uncharacterized protein n=1 Tax=Anguilla anguilla TaxID=7936 RepID=A0A0E9RN30_ANGAN
MVPGHQLEKYLSINHDANLIKATQKGGQVEETAS